MWTVAIADSVLSPVAACSQRTLVVTAAGAGPFDSHVGTLALMNVLVAGAAVGCAVLPPSASIAPRPRGGSATPSASDSSRSSSVRSPAVVQGTDCHDPSVAALVMAAATSSCMRAPVAKSGSTVSTLGDRRHPPASHRVGAPEDVPVGVVHPIAWRAGPRRVGNEQWTCRPPFARAHTAHLLHGVPDR